MTKEGALYCFMFLTKIKTVLSSAQFLCTKSVIVYWTILLRFSTAHGNFLVFLFEQSFDNVSIVPCRLEEILANVSVLFSIAQCKREEEQSSF